MPSSGASVCTEETVTTQGVLIPALTSLPPASLTLQKDPKQSVHI